MRVSTTTQYILWWWYTDWGKEALLQARFVWSVTYPREQVPDQKGEEVSKLYSCIWGRHHDWVQAGWQNGFAKWG